MVKVYIWDLPTRLFHWVLAVSVLGLVITGNVGGSAMVWHFRFGYLVLTLIFFRFAWGIFGGFWSRWSQLPIGPLSVLSYIKGPLITRHLAGHNPLGSISIITMLFFLTLQVATGLVSDDEIANSGPLSSLVSSSTVSLATSWHKNWGKFIIIGLVALHLMALVWSRYRKHQALVSAMWHGFKDLPEWVTGSDDQLKSRSLAFVIFLIAAGIVFGIVSLAQ